MIYVLHYAPDNASAIIRIALLELDLSFDTRLFDRRIKALGAGAFFELNPSEHIPVLETGRDVLFETGSILLWLADRHMALAPKLDEAEKDPFLNWLFWFSNMLQPALSMPFQSETYLGQLTEETVQDLREAQKISLAILFMQIDQETSSRYGRRLNSILNIFQIYMKVCLRWVYLYLSKDETDWFDLNTRPNPLRLYQKMESRKRGTGAACAEEQEHAIFSNPSRPNPPQGSAP